MQGEWDRSGGLSVPHTECDSRLAGEPSWRSLAFASKPANKISYLALVNTAVAVSLCQLHLTNETEPDAQHQSS